ncbi:Monocarboxylate transporter 13 [Chelonia mydas]|uniref:Monocarboxylate transporter 13 n=1 Tax=Chelonia mydas TaxID=8469 RepID=M7C0B1_CHEMY|nr:Monocarboxylate transporter 13 [Chelonia mydas]
MRFVLAVTLINTGYFIPSPVPLGAGAGELGFDEYQAAFLMSVAAVTDLCGRLLSGWLADCRVFHLSHILVAWTSLTGISLALVPLGCSYPLLMAIGICYGFFSGALTPVVFSILPEIVGIRQIFGSMGLLQMMESIGWLRDMTGDYTASFLAAGAFLLAGSLVLVTLPNFFSCDPPPPACHGTKGTAMGDPMAELACPEPPDGGWGWMVVLAGFLQSALVFGVIRSFGVFFMEFVGYFGELAGRVSWVTSIGIAVQQLGGPVGSALSTQYGARPVVMAGGVLSGLGMFLASFATSLTHLYLSIGLLSGLGWALVFTPSVASVAQYFGKRRAFATGLAVSGAGLASFAFSPLFQLLVDTYAWRGALMVVAGISFNLVAAGALLRPLELEGNKASVPEAGWLQLPAFSSFCRPRLPCHRPFLLFSVAFILVDAGYYVPYVHLVPHARELGFDEYRAAFLLSSAAVAVRPCGGRLAGRPLRHPPGPQPDPLDRPDGPLHDAGAPGAELLPPDGPLRLLRLLRRRPGAPPVLRPGGDRGNGAHHGGDWAHANAGKCWLPCGGPSVR